MFRNFFIFCSVFSAIYASAQNTINNIYSLNHLGFFEHNENAYQMALGGIKYGLIDSTMSNGSNASTMSFLTKGQPVFNLETTGRFSFFQSLDNSVNSRFVYLRTINFAIPFANRYGLGFGYRPKFSKGYRFNEYQTVEISGDSLNRIYAGNDGVYQAYLSFSVAPIKNKYTFWSIGLEGNFNFGHPTDNRAVEFVNFSNSNAVNILSDTIRGFGFSLSTSLNHAFSDDVSLSFGASYTTSSKLNTTFTDRLLGYQGNFGSTYQVVQQISDAQYSGTFTTPSVLGAGLGLNFHPQDRSGKFRTFFDFEHITWSDYKRNLTNVVDTSFVYANTTNYRIGLEYTPEYINSDRATNKKYLSFVSYRLGLNMSHIAIPEQNLNDRGMTFGFGFPVKTGPNSVSTINLGVRLGRVGTVGVNSVRENYVAYQIGFMIRPTSIGERWFKKYEYK